MTRSCTTSLQLWGITSQRGCLLDEAHERQYVRVAVQLIVLRGQRILLRRGHQLLTCTVVLPASAPLLQCASLENLRTSLQTGAATCKCIGDAELHKEIDRMY